MQTNLIPELLFWVGIVYLYFYVTAVYTPAATRAENQLATVVNILPLEMKYDSRVY